MSAEVTVAPLSGAERGHLLVAESTIDRGLHTFVEVGDALAQVRDGRLYRETHATFEDYCRQRWGLSRTHVDRTIAAAQIVAPIGAVDAGAPLPVNEGQARELAGLEPEQAAEVMREAVTQSEGRVTASVIRRVRTEVEAPPGDLPPFDPRTGEVLDSEADRARRERREAERKAADERRARSELYTPILRALLTLGTYGAHDDIRHLMAEYDREELDPPQLHGKALSPDNLAAAARFVAEITTWRDAP